MLSAKETKESLLKKKLSKYSADLPKTEKIALENQITTDIKTAIQQTTMETKAIEIQTAPSTIFGIAASTALIYTASAMMGALMKYGIGISIQLLMPQNR